MIDRSNFEKLDEVLSYENSVDYWEDEESEFALIFVKSFQESDWLALRSTWTQKSNIWKERCAQILDCNKTEIGFRILIDMLQSENLDITVNAVEALESFGSEFEWKSCSDKHTTIAKSTIDKSNLTVKAKEDYLRKINKLKR